MTTVPGQHTTLPSAGSQASARVAAGLAIRWVFPDTSGGVTALRQERVVLGRGDECDARLPGKETSREHAEIRRDGPIAILRDLGSTNGVFVNGTQVEQAPIELGDVLRLGEWVGIVARSDAAAAARSDLPMVIGGETGTGKERVARLVHAWSGRTGAFVGINCAALPESLAEAELFGYPRGAFTGAVRASAGHFRSAHGGTLLLDEATDLPPPLQAKLLRVLEQREVLPLGESSPVGIDVRVLVATQEPLLACVQAGRFRPDLCARLEGVTVRLPPLRDRIVEVPYLFARLLHDRSGGPRRSSPSSSRLSACTTGRSTCASSTCWCAGCSPCTATRRRCGATTCPSACLRARPRASRARRRAMPGGARRLLRSRARTRRGAPRSGSGSSVPCASTEATSRAPLPPWGCLGSEPTV
jgi:hypothetical protein